MKKLTLILVAAIAAASLSSCGTAGHLASGYDTEEMRNVMLFVKGKVDFPQIGFEKGTTERGVSKVSKSC